MDGASLARLLGDTWFGWDLLPDVRERLAGCARLVHLPAGCVLTDEGHDLTLDDV